MTCSRPRFALRPVLENLESRLQPGSVITGAGYGWSLLADNLSILNPGSSDFRLVSQTSSESSRPALTRSAADSHSNYQTIAVAPVTAARNDSRPTGKLADALVTDLTNDELGVFSLPDHARTVRMLAVENTVAHPVTPMPASAAFLESPLGVTPPAASAANALTSQTTLTGSALHSESVRAAAADQATAVTLGTAQPIQLGSTTNIASSLHAVPNLHVTITHSDSGSIHAFASVPVWASYLGASGDDRILGIALNPVQGAAQPVVVTGFTQSTSDPTEYDGALATFSTDGSAATLMTLGFGTGTRTEGHSVDVDSAGNMYVIGQTGQTSDPTTNTDLIVRIDPTGKMNWAASFTPSGSTGVGNGLRLDAKGANLYVTGSVDGNVVVGELTGLDTAAPTFVYNNEFTFTAGPTVGSAIAPDSQGNADVAFTLSSGADNLPAFGQVAPDGTLPATQRAAFTSVGSRSGGFGITVDASDNFYLTGGIQPSGSPAAQLLIAKYDVTFSQQWAFRYSFSDPTSGNPVDVVGRGVKVDDAGDAFMACVRDGGTIRSGGSGVRMKLFEVDPTGGNSLDNQNRAAGTGDDENRALALDTTNSVLYMAGFTSSTDFNFTTGSFQSAYGGDPFDGILIQDQLT
jgi:hypothetical protein